jgi:polyhydroxybutyrate depolymerase
MRRFRRLLRMLLTGILLLILAMGIYFYLQAGPSLRCHAPHNSELQTGLAARTLVSNGLQRCYLIYIPAQVNLQHATALVFSWHGLAMNPDGMIALTDWNTVADEAGFVVIYPQGTAFPLRWNAIPAYNIPTVDDVQFFRDMVADLQTIMTVDTARTYVNGISNGAAMTTRLACEAADIIAAVGEVAGGEFLTGCHPERAVPLIYFHGTRDPLAAYDGDVIENSWLSDLMNISPNGLVTPPVPEWVAAWAQQNGCQPEPASLPIQDDVSGVRYEGCQDNGEVVFYTIDEGGHTWAGGQPNGLGKTTNAIHASRAMWAFFEAHSLSQPAGA